MFFPHTFNYSYIMLFVIMQMEILATSPFILLVFYYIVMYYKNSGHTSQALVSVSNSTTMPVVKPEMVTMSLLLNRSAPEPVYPKVVSVLS